jgi:uncharacterized repeat protein (TIGR02543 family)
LLIGFFLFFGFSEFGMAAAAAAKPIKLCYSTSGIGAGSVTFSPTGTPITTNNKCANYLKNDSVILTASGGTNSSFASWSGCTPSKLTPCTVKLTANKTVKATYTPYPKLTIVSDNIKGTISSSSFTCSAYPCTKQFAPQTVIGLSALANDGYSFSGWTGACVTKASTCSITFTKAVKLTASFSKPKATGKEIGSQMSVSPPK